MIADSVTYFDEVNVATALHRLAKLHTSNSANHSNLIINSDQFKQLTHAITRLLPHFEPQAVSNTMWAFATLAYYPEVGRHVRICLAYSYANDDVSLLQCLPCQA